MIEPTSTRRSATALESYVNTDKSRRAIGHTIRINPSLLEEVLWGFWQPVSVAQGAPQTETLNSVVRRSHSGIVPLEQTRRCLGSRFRTRASVLDVAVGCRTRSKFGSQPGWGTMLPTTVDSPLIRFASPAAPRPQRLPARNHAVPPPSPPRGRRRI